MIPTLQSQLVQLQASSLLGTVATQSTLFIAQLIQLHPESVNEQGWGGLTPLHKACLRGQLDIIELLLSHGAQLEVDNEGEETPFLFAARRGNPLALETLARAGANVNKVDSKGRSAVHHAAFSGSLLSLFWLESATGLPMDQNDLSGATPLFIACQQGKHEVVKFLLRRQRCSVNLVDNSGNNCLHAAAEAGHDNIAYLVTMAPGGYKLLSLKNDAGELPKDVIQAKCKADPADTKLAGTKRFFDMVFYMPTFESVKMGFLGLQLVAAGTPFLLYLAAILASRSLYPAYGIWMFAAASLAGTLFVKTQVHRMLDASRSQNPVFAAAFVTGIVHTLLCFYVEILPRVPPGSAGSLRLAAGGTAALLAFVYVALLVKEPGKVTRQDVNYNPATRSPLSYAEHIRQLKEFAVDGYCTTCEISFASPRVKHCKLCNYCVVDMDHHCLFLLKCIAKNNHRFFIFLIGVSMASIALFLYSCYLFYQPLCIASREGVVATVACLARVSPWVFSAFLFNVVSFIWGFFMLRFQLTVVSVANTSFFVFKAKSRFTLYQRIMNVIYFLVFGRFYKVNDAIIHSFSTA